MNPNSTSNSSRIKRIKLVSRLFRVLIGIAAAFLLLVGCLAFLYAVTIIAGGKVVPGQSMTVNIAFSPHQCYILSSDSPLVPWPVLLLGVIHWGLIACGLIVLNRLFKLFELGSFFKMQNVRYLKTLGFVVTASGLIQTTLELLSPTHVLNFGLLAIGAMVLLIAWIMDEGRRIQEEHELTV